MTNEFTLQEREFMAQALSLAARGQGTVEPNPMVGCLIVARGEAVGRGWHQRFGGLHAEVEALRDAGEAAQDATMYVTLEPCCHQGKTPPCVDAILQAGIRRVVVAMRDPFPKVDGSGLGVLQNAGLEVALGLAAANAQSLNAPYLKHVQRRRPWLIAKWAMTLDGKLASRSENSQWISNPASRAVAHQLRGRMDAIIVGRRTAVADDPLLTARPPGPRAAMRIVLDTNALLSLDSQLVRTAHDVPVLIAASESADSHRCRRLQNAGCEVVQLAGDNQAARLSGLLDELDRRQMTNVLIEGGSQVLGTAFDARLIDEVHVFIAPKLLGGSQALTPVGGLGLAMMSEAHGLDEVSVEQLGGDIYVSGRLLAATH
jgi:diaminohydroxyphosphoribosylaminopyrimidine deaminase/5-amino-6-(5-phosphoribosylamino)uracil reductase